MSLIGREVYESVPLLRALALTENVVETAEGPEPGATPRGLDDWGELAERPQR